MSINKRDCIKIKRGILGPGSGSTGNIIIAKNKVIYIKKSKYESK
jgi:hypothetical protein